MGRIYRDVFMALICSKLNRNNTQHCPTDDKTQLASGFYASMFEHTVKLPKKVHCVVARGDIHLLLHYKQTQQDQANIVSLDQPHMPGGFPLLIG